MKITLEALENGTVPIDALRQFVIAYNSIDVDRLNQEESHAVYLARATLLEPMPGSPAAKLAERVNDCLTIVPFVTSTGARLTSVTRRRRPFVYADGSTGCNTYLDVTYDDGVVVDLWCDYGDYGVTLVTDADGKAAFLTSMTSDGHFDVCQVIGMRPDEIGFLPRVNELADTRLSLLAGNVDPEEIAADPSYRFSESFNRGTAPKSPARPNLAKLYAAPPSPRGRAPLGRRS